MGELLMRRREMIIPQAEPSSGLIYSLYNQAVSGGDYINTGITPFANGSDMTILFDMTITTNSGGTSTNYYRYILIFVGNTANGLRVGKPSQYSEVIRAQFIGAGDTDATGKIGTSAAGRKRIVITHVGGTSTVRAIGKMGTGTPLEKTVTGSNTLNQDGALVFGSSSNTAGLKLPPGTITKAEVYNYVLPDEEINAFLA